MLVYPDFTALDLVGPHHVFSAMQGYEVKLVWKTTESVKSDLGLTVKPDMTFADCPEAARVTYLKRDSGALVSESAPVYALDLTGVTLIDDIIALGDLHLGTGTW